ncbi:EXTENSIN PROLINE-RICH PROTEIN [Salix purpurea]|uniref:EXTENSIN PROLINE-RICH PROTEIN n=1 Tax=Salix purpurea TaxID=77065 RepID=A0A9Q0W3A7_SALPP|nr:EXTENSIN PROLINE-RICH PROTEIN [Salix purpurea]
MAVRLLLALMVFVFCSAEVSSDLKIDTGALHGGQLVVRAGNRRLMQDIDCGGLCNQRCSLHSRPNVCTRACGTCCVRCKCVPPGTSGNREVCGTCYTDMTTHGNKTKCPEASMDQLGLCVAFYLCRLETLFSFSFCRIE